MPDQLHAVMATVGDSKPLIQAVFSSEGLAQTHAAKLRLDESGIAYTVEPLGVDTEVDQEMAYLGYYSIESLDRGALVVREEDIRVSPAGLWRTLPADLADDSVRIRSAGLFNTDVLFYAYGWDRGRAHRRALQLVTDYLNGWGRPWTLIPWEDNEYE